VQLANARAGLGRGRQRDGVGHHQLVEYGVLNILNGAAGQHRVRGVGVDLGGTALLERLGGMAQGAGGIDHVVDQNAGAALDITDDVHHFGVVGLLATFVDDRQVYTQALGHGARTHHTADVRGNDHQVVDALVFDLVDQYRRAVAVVDWSIE